MDYGALLAAVLCFLVSGVLLMLAAWFRWGRSGAARWWVRRRPVDRMMFMHAAGEGVALGLVPYLGQLMAAIGVVLLLAVHPGVRDVLHAPVMWTVVALEIVLAIVVMMLVSNRQILALFVYPGWLRPQRRAERQWLDGRR